MMEKAKTFFAILGIGVLFGSLVTVILIYIIGAVPRKIVIGSVEYELSTPTVVEQKTIEATQKPVSGLTQKSTMVINIDDIIPQIKGEEGELPRVYYWWSEVEYGGENGAKNPVSPGSNIKCFGLAWNTTEYGYHRLIVFQKQVLVNFAAGGWYTKVCVPNTVVISAEDVGKIQADWLGKRYGIDNTPWEVIVVY